jgi:site-specific recombinase XerD
MSEELKNLTAAFLAEEELKKRRPQGFKTLKRGLPRFIQYVSEHGYSLAGFGAKEALGYQKYLIEGGRRDGKPYRDKTILSLLYSATCFCAYLTRKGFMHSNPFREIPKLRTKKRLPKNLLKEQELADFLSFTGRFYEEESLVNQITRYKLHLVFELQYSTGLRISEVASLKVEDVELLRGFVQVRDGKGGKERVVFLNEYTKGLLTLYLKRFRTLTFNEGNEKNATLLLGMKPGNLVHKVNTKLKKLTKAYGIERISSHHFRHAYGYHMLRAGCNIRHIQQLLGHEQLRTTEIYTKVDKEDLKKVLDACHPRRWRGGPL